MKKVEGAEVKKVEIKNDLPNFKSAIVYIPLVLLLIVVAGGIGAYVKYANAAYVNGKPISRLEYIKNMEKQGGKQVLDGMIQESLVEGEAEKKGVKIDQSEIDTDLKNIENRVKSQGQTLDAALAAQNMTKEDLVKQIRLQKLAEKMANAPTQVSQKQIDDFIAQNKEQFPKTATKTDMETAAKTQLLDQARNEAIGKWFTALKSNAKIIYR